MRRSFWKSVYRGHRPDLALSTGIVLAVALIALAFIAPSVWGDAARTLTADVNQPPSSAHLLGTDSLGRDMLARSLTAVRLTLIMATAACAISVVFGTAIGIGLWLAPRRLREIGLRTIEVLVSYPSILVAILIAAILGAGATPAVIAVGAAGIPAFARMTANMAAALSQQDFVATARIIGVPRRRIATAHLLPNMAEPVLIMIAAAYATVLVEIAGLSFIGFGVQPPSFDFGRLLVDAIPAIYSRPSQIIGPAAMIIVTGLAAMLIGDGLAARSNVRSGASPRKHRHEGRLASLMSSRDSYEPVKDGQPAANSLLDVRNLCIDGPDGTALVKNVDLRIANGEVLGLVGESGSGKSLTAMAIAQLLADNLTVQAERLSLAGMDLRNEVDSRSLATSIGLVYQDPGSTFNPALKMGAQLTEVMTRHMGMTKRDARARAVDSFAKVHLKSPSSILKQYPYELSGGMRQRAMIASVLCTDPDLIVADEPTTALDVTVQAEILRELYRIKTERKTSMLFISHDLGVVQELCDRVIVMRGGEIVEELSIDDLKNRNAKHSYTQKLLNAMPTLDDHAPAAPPAEREAADVVR